MTSPDMLTRRAVMVGFRRRFKSGQIRQLRWHKQRSPSTGSLTNSGTSRRLIFSSNHMYEKQHFSFARCPVPTILVTFSPRASGRLEKRHRIKRLTCLSVMHCFVRAGGDVSRLTLRRSTLPTESSSLSPSNFAMLTFASLSASLQTSAHACISSADTCMCCFSIWHRHSQ